MSETCKKARHKKDRALAEARTARNRAKRIAKDQRFRANRAAKRAKRIAAGKPVRRLRGVS